MNEPFWKSLDPIEQLCKVALEDIQKCFSIKKDLWQEYVEKEIKLNKDLMSLIHTRQDNFDWKKETPLGGAGTTLNAIILYCLIRNHNMNEIIETGVSGGYYTSFILTALQKNEPSVERPIYVASLEISDEEEKIGKLIPESVKNFEFPHKWDFRKGKSSLYFFEKFKKHSAQLYSHDSLHTLKHMLLEFNEFKKSISNEFYVFIDDEKSENFWNWCIDKGQFKKSGFVVKYISGQESRLRGHLGGFLKFQKVNEK